MEAEWQQLLFGTPKTLTGSSNRASDELLSVMLAGLGRLRMTATFTAGQDRGPMSRSATVYRRRAVFLQGQQAPAHEIGPMLGRDGATVNEAAQWIVIGILVCAVGWLFICVYSDRI